MILGDNGFADVQTVILKFDDFLTVHTDEVTMAGGIGEVGIVLGRLLAQSHLPDQAGPDQKGEGSVDGGPGNCGVAAPAAGKKRLGGEMFPVTKDRFSDQSPLGGEPESLGAHAFKRALLGTRFLPRGLQSAPFSRPSPAPRDFGPFNALRNLFTAGLTTREERETTPRGRTISAP